MKFTPPYSLCGLAGKTLDATWRTLSDLGVHSALLIQRSLDADELNFTLRAKAGRIIPDDGQWITLKDATGTVLLTGIAKRRFIYPAALYQYVVTNVYRGLLETPLTDITGKAYLLYNSQDLATTVAAILDRANALGLAIQAPASMPAMFAAPKMAFRSASCGSALEDTLKWLPDTASRMDYSTTPATLQFSCRGSSTPVVIDLDTPGHGVTALDLTAMPEARAFFVAFVYAVRDGASVVSYLTQSAGDSTADAQRALSIYLSGHERTEMLVSEALVTSNNALLTAQASLAAANAAIVAVNAQISATYAAALAAIPGTPDIFDWLSYLKIKDSTLAATVAYCAANSITPPAWMTYYGITLWVGYNWQSTGGTSAPIHYSSAGWPVATGAFTDAQLTAAGATKVAGTMLGTIMFSKGSGQNFGYPALISGWSEPAEVNYYSWCFHNVSGIAVDILSKAPTVIRSTLKAIADAAANGPPAGSAATSFIDRAEFVEAPADLASNYFARQDWTPYSGQLSLSPSAPVLPAPGDFVSLTGTGLPAEFATMATPASELTVDLATGAATVTLGPSPRMTFASLQDRLRIPAEDNYQPG